MFPHLTRDLIHGSGGDGRTGFAVYNGSVFYRWLFRDEKA